MADIQHEFFATCPSGLESVLGAELLGMGCLHVRPLQGGVAYSGSRVDAYRACLWSRMASRVLGVVGRVNAQSAKSLYSDAVKITWPEIFSPEKTIAVYAKGTNTELRNTQFTALKVKDAICDSFRSAGLPRPSVDSDHPDVRIQVAVHKRRATVYVDYSGDSLHRRGYRASSKGKSHEAPLKEALAAGMLLWAGWGSGSQPYQLCDPVCGSGTLVIEAAMIAADMAPGILRQRWGFEGLSGFDEAAWSALLTEADERFEEGLKQLEGRQLEGNAGILGSDLDPEAVEMASSCAKSMGLGNVLQFVQADCAHMSQTMQDAGFDLRSGGLVAMNPPYGVRLLKGEMEAFYENLSTGLRPLGPEWSMVAITPDPLFDTQIGFDADRALETFNGPIETSMRHYVLGSSVVRGLGVVSMTGREVEVPVSSMHSDQFAARLRKAAKQARKWARREGVKAYRVYDRDLPDYSLSIDEYEDADSGDVHLMVCEYKAPGEIDPNKAARRFNDAVAIAAATLEADPENMHVRTRRRDVGGRQYSHEGREGNREVSGNVDRGLVMVEEGGHRFEVHMEGALDTGLFLDHRPVRGMIESEAKGKRFLNLFAYTGSVSVYAAAGGAKSTTTVDMNKGYLEWARRNMNDNGFSGPEHSFVRADVLEWLEKRAGNARSWEAQGEGRLQQQGQSQRQGQGRAQRKDQAQQQGEGEFDLVFVDPPTFSNSKAMGDRSWDIQRDHAGMLSTLRRLLAPGAVVYFSGNQRSFKLDEDAVRKAGFEVDNITESTIPEDFKRNQKIHFCYRLEAV